MIMAGTDKKYVETPLMKQYYQIKSVHPDAILLFRVGDFYETFGDDAIKASGILGITLTRRANGSATFVELAGFPYHAIDTYLPKLVRAGERVAICEQLEDPKLVKGLVKRGVIELVTPGVVLGDNLLANKENVYLASVYFGRQTTGVAFLDISTGEFYVAEGPDNYIDKLLSNLSPKEIIYQRGFDERFRQAFGTNYYTYKLDDWVFSEELNREKLCKQFGTQSLKGFGIDHISAGISAAGAILYYLEFTEHKEIGHIASISRIDQDDYVWIDKFTIRNLELFTTNGSRDRSSFANVMDRTLTPMGGRLLKRWIAMPIRDIGRINRRLDVVQRFVEDSDLAEAVGEQVSLIGDLERIASRIAAARVTPRELVQLKNSLAAIELLKAILESTDDGNLHRLAAEIDVLAQMRLKLEREIYPDPANNQIQKGGVIADGVNPELDDLRRIALHGKDVLQQIQQRESELTGIPSLKIGYNNIFGYFIEVRNAHKEKVPDTWIRKQTLSNAERYITEELKEYEEKILGAEDRILTLEQEIYNALIAFVSQSLSQLLRDAHAVARVDCFLSFARIARERNYVRPELDDGARIDIEQGRHPVIETLMPVGEKYIPNDIRLDDEEQQIVMITGPNMSGKSALLRQTALIILMAQMGSFVPARRAHIGVVDKIFTRVGASDNISQGESTFMVEMLESASILNNISDRSIVLLDEIGRGTSTYDGIFDRLGDGRIPAQPPHGPCADALRDPLSRAERDGKDVPAREELPRHGQGDEQHDRLPAQARTRRHGTFVRYSCRQNGRHAGVGRVARRRDSQKPGEGLRHRRDRAEQKPQTPRAQAGVGQGCGRRGRQGGVDAVVDVPARRSGAGADPRSDQGTGHRFPYAARSAQQAERDQEDRRYLTVVQENGGCPERQPPVLFQSPVSEL